MKNTHISIKDVLISKYLEKDLKKTQPKTSNINVLLNRIELNKKIESLEDKVSANLDEKLYSELLSLRNQLKRG